MNTPSLDHVAVILVEPQNPGNIGMVCRAMANFGASDLRLVNPCAHLHPEARKFAVAANHLLGQARLFSDLASAIADLQLTVATTRRTGRLRGELLDIAAVPGLQAELPPGGRLGLVFGREDAGLTSEEVALCSRAASVATAAEVGSLNLAQAVLLFLHELSRLPARPLSPEPAEPPNAAELEALFRQIEHLLSRIAFLNPAHPEGVMNTLRRLHHRAGLDRRDLAILRGMWSQLEWSVNDWRGRKRGEG
ncbi:MAG TPA: RNA methyltransferase [Desulfuromonadales bacterium]